MKKLLLGFSAVLLLIVLAGGCYSGGNRGNYQSSDDVDKTTTKR